MPDQPACPDLSPATLAVTAGRPPHEPDQPLNTPITMASTYVAGGDLEYGRYGNPTWLATHPVPTRSSPVVEALLAAGATAIGKTITDELAYSINGDNAHYGTPENTRAPGRVPGGSSSGSAAAAGAAVTARTNAANSRWSCATASRPPSRSCRRRASRRWTST